MTHPVPNRKSSSKSKLAAGRAVAVTGKIRRYLRSLGHGLAPVVQIGKSGLSAGVKDELDRALSFHELIKVRLLAECPIPREQAGTQIASLTHSEHIQTLGGVLLFYRGRLDKPRILIPGLDDKKIKAARTSKKKLNSSINRGQPKKPSARSKASQQGRKALRKHVGQTPPGQRRESPRADMKRR
jgi:RNA-binding protein